MDDKLRNAYDRLAQDYAKTVDAQSGANAYYERPAMMGRLPDRMDGLRALDAGCAAGWYSEQLAARGADVTAVDLSPAMAEAATARLGQKARVLTLDLAEPLPFEDASFDLVLSSLTLHYLKDWAPTFREFRRVLTAGGRFLFSVHHPFMDFTEFKRPNYFTRELLTDVWTKPEAGRVEVWFYRRPLEEIVNTTTSAFILDAIEEPQPIREFLKTGQAAFYERLKRNPHFLIVDAHVPAEQLREGALAARGHLTKS
ncbi:MAG: class I SAM-dependent methyltransferase [Firmicutes bacterium]|nr:class I SAM-dependent methyltransferase [Bacillota bacterium]